MRNYYLLVGPSGIGKSTWLKKTTEKLTQDSVTMFYVASRDEIVHEVAKENGLSYTEMFAVPTEFVSEKTVLLETGQRVFELQHKLQTEVDSRFAKLLFKKLEDESVTNVYVDMTNLSRKTRRGHIKRFLGLDYDKAVWNVQAVCFLKDEQKEKVLDLLIERCSKREEQPIAKEVLEGQLNRYSEPNLEAEPYLTEIVWVEGITV